MDSVTDLGQGGLEYSTVLSHSFFYAVKGFEYAADADVSNLSGSVPMHLVRYPVHEGTQAAKTGSIASR